MFISEKDFEERLDKAIKSDDGRSYMFTLKVKKDQVLSKDQVSSACNKWQVNSEITHVYMGDCGLTDEAIDPLLEALKSKKGKPIKSLSMPNNQISEDGFGKLADFIENNNSLSMVVLDGNKISHASRERLEAAIAKRAHEGFPVKIIHGESLGSTHAKSNQMSPVEENYSHQTPTSKILPTSESQAVKNNIFSQHGKGETEQNKQSTLAAESFKITGSKNHQSSEGTTAKSLINLAEKSLEISFLGLPLACAFFVASKICDVISFIGSKINSAEKLGPVAKEYESSLTSASATPFGSFMMDGQLKQKSRTYEACDNTL